MSLFRLKTCAVATALMLAPLTAHAAPHVLVSVKPVHSLAAAIMKGVGEPGLIVDGAASPHTYQMKPSDAARLQDAELIFWIGHGFEAFLEKPLETLGSKARIVELDHAPGLTKLKFREGGPFEAHTDEAEGADEAGHDHEAGHDDGQDEHHGEIDMHIWLSVANAKALAGEIAARLTEADPANAKAYADNLASLSTRLDGLSAEISGILAPVKEKSFIVFHDAYQYFEHDFGVRVAGSITVSPETMPGAERLADIRGKVATLKATCVFAEPQFEPRLIDTVLDGTEARRGTLDPEGGTLIKGEELYFDLMRGIATSIRTCLGK